ncbi:MAG: adenylate/guanylate cyclase domain-containing protein [Chloroflexota bacterium]
METRVVLRHAADELWPLVANTDAINRAVGLPVAHFIRGEAGQGERDVGEYRLWGIPYARWIEHPFEWERPRRFHVEREYTKGPVKHFQGGTELTALEGGGTCARVFAELVPQSLFTYPLLKLGIAPRSMRRARKRYLEIDRFLDGQVASAFPPRRPRLSSGAGAALDRVLGRVRAAGSPPECVALLRALLLEGEDDAVAGMRPLELADTHGLDPRQLMETCFRATVEGALEMRWELRCPSCRGVKATALHLNILGQTGHCEACNLDFAADVDEHIEARFYPAPRIRDVNVGIYCVGGPMVTAHRLASSLIPPGESKSWTVPLDRGAYYLRCPQARGLARLTAEPEVPAGSSIRAAVIDGALSPSTLQADAGLCTFTIANNLAQVATVVLDKVERSQYAATPSRMLLYPEFHSLFSGEALAEGVSVEVGKVGLLFTDLSGSTSLYERSGDAPAFRLVTEHFAILRRVIEGHGGAVVKTIGDAVMAAFPEGLSAVQAALEIQDAIRDMPTRGLADPLRLVKVGVHEGPCFIVTENDQLDYFGTTVNVAARTQHEAKGGEVTMTAEVYTLLRTVDSMRASQATSFEVRLRGISTPVCLYRIDCAASPPA